VRASQFCGKQVQRAFIQLSINGDNSSSIIEDLLSRQTNSSLAVAFYYFDFNDVGKRDTTSLIRALVAQLLAKIPATANILEVLSSQIDDKQPDINFLLEILQKFIQELDQTCIVVDALDECEECEELMNLVEKTHGWESDRLHILVTSRQLPEIEEVVADCATSSICLQNSVNQDIHILIQERLSSDRKFQKWPYQVRCEIDEALTGGASGMYVFPTSFGQVIDYYKVPMGRLPTGHAAQLCHLACSPKGVENIAKDS
jgi:hypothetical protein